MTRVRETSAGVISAIALLDAGEVAHALALLESAVAAAPRAADAHLGHAMALEAALRPQEAIGAYARALAFDRRLESAACRLTSLLESYPGIDCAALDRRGLKAALAFASIDPLPVARAGFAWLKVHALAPATAAGRTDGWARAAAWLLGKGREALADPLLAACLREGINTDPEVEKLLTALRRALLLDREALRRRPGRDLACLLVEQALNNEFVWYVSDEERAALAALADAPDTLLARALYQPPGDLVATEAEARAARPRALAEIFARELAAARAERALAETVPTLAPIDDAVSRRVAAQYEANPYPRWRRVSVPEPGSYRRYLARFFAASELAFLERPFAVLIAGCGTGAHAIGAALGYGTGARLCALDLSRASLAYAARRARDYGVDIAFVQGDLLDAPRLERRFEVVEAVGVLHHMADPLAGWRALAERLAPGGLMHVGLYSARARAEIAALRAEIARRRLPTDGDGVRGFRHDLLVGGDFGRQTMEGGDFYTLSSCRDLLFHARERPVTIAEIGAWLAALGLEFRGFVLPDARTARFRLEHPGTDPQRDLAAWDAFEAEHARTFAGMYQLWCRKPADG